MRRPVGNGNIVASAIYAPAGPNSPASVCSADVSGSLRPPLTVWFLANDRAMQIRYRIHRKRGLPHSLNERSAVLVFDDFHSRRRSESLHIRVMQ